MIFANIEFAKIHVKYKNKVEISINLEIADHSSNRTTNAVNISRYRKRFAEKCNGREKGSRGWLRDARHREITSRVSHPQRGGWAAERTLSTPRPRNHCPGGYLSCLLVYEIQHCYLAPHRGVLGAMRPVVSGEFPTLKGRVPERDYVLTYPRFFPLHDRL